MRQRNVPSVQIIYSILEPDPARLFISTAEECETGLLSRVPHASGLLDGSYKPSEGFSDSDHRSHRRQEAAIQFVLAQPSIASVLPNFLNEETIREFTSAPDTPPLSEDEQSRLAELIDKNFYVEEPVPAGQDGA